MSFCYCSNFYCIFCSSDSAGLLVFSEHSVIYDKMLYLSDIVQTFTVSSKALSVFWFSENTPLCKTNVSFRYCLNFYCLFKDAINLLVSQNTPLYMTNAVSFFCFYCLFRCSDSVSLLVSQNTPLYICSRS